MFTKTAALISLISLTFSLTGCALTPPQGQQETCMKMKREWIFNNSNAGHGLNPAQKAKFQQQMLQNNCH